MTISQSQRLCDRFGRRNLLVRIAEHRLFRDTSGLAQDCLLADLDLVVEQLPHRLEREVLLLQGRHPLQEFVASVLVLDRQAVDQQPVKPAVVLVERRVRRTGKEGRDGIGGCSVQM